MIAQIKSYIKTTCVLPVSNVILQEQQDKITFIILKTITSPVAPDSRGLGCNKSAYLEIYTPEKSIKINQNTLYAEC